MSKLIAAFLTVSSLALTSFSPATATTTSPKDILNPDPTFPGIPELTVKQSEPNNNMEVALIEVCDYYSLPNGYVYYECRYY